MSGSLSDFLDEQRANVPGAEVWRGTVQKTATTVTERLTVTLPAYPGNLDLPIGCRWQPRFEPHIFDVSEASESTHNLELARIVYPQKGDACVVAFDENDEPWVLLYSPAGT